MKIHAFKVEIDSDNSATLEEVLEQIKNETGFKERIRQVGQTELILLCQITPEPFSVGRKTV